MNEDETMPAAFRVTRTFGGNRRGSEVELDPAHNDTTALLRAGYIEVAHDEDE